MAYHMRFSLEYNPFLKNSKDIIIETKDYKQIQQRLKFLSDNNGFGIITGEPGRGKTTAVRHWAASLSPSRFKVVYTSLSTLTLNEFYRHLAEEFGLEPKFRKSQNYKLIQAEINRYHIEKKITPVFVIDEANYINSSILNEFKMLFNFEMDSRDRAIVLLIGGFSLNTTLNRASNEPLRQRITMNYSLNNLNQEDSKIYIKTRLQAAGAPETIFDEQAIKSITNASNGIPRIINKICDMCLRIGDAQKIETIDSEIILMAVNEIELS
ncbi:MAG: AAA family ATPase [Streptococcaceae bacterium]|jgi:type II secretory pathway predicted ATPase ExeA|nr:AAA family ATPase [Streptococcaceae bacterium]